MRARLRRFLDQLLPYVARGGPYEKYRVLYDMVDGFLFTPGEVTRVAPHVRDGIDLKRVMTYVIWALSPCIVMGLWNTGYQANHAMQVMGLEVVPGWRGSLLQLFDISCDPDSFLDNISHGLLYFLPVYLVALLASGFWETLFAALRNHEINEGFLVTSLLFSLVLPPTIPLWQAALGISFGVVIGKEVFGGTGKNVLNPALTGRAFLFFAYPAQNAGDAVWTAVDGFSGATPLALAANGGVAAITDTGISWMHTFLGTIQGCMGSTSALACLAGAAFLLYTRIANYRIMLGVFLGMLISSGLFNIVGGSSNPMFAMPWYWHLTLGGFAFGMIFMATDPVTSAMTNAGRWIYGLIIGVMTVMIRVLNPAYPEGVMLAILFANLFSPLIDYCVMQVNIARRKRRYA